MIALFTILRTVSEQVLPLPIVITVVTILRIVSEQVLHQPIVTSVVTILRIISKQVLHLSTVIAVVTILGIISKQVLHLPVVITVVGILRIVSGCSLKMRCETIFFLFPSLLVMLCVTSGHKAKDITPSVNWRRKACKEKAFNSL